MSELQDQAKPILVKMVSGQWPDLTDAEGEIIARWCTMVSINIAKYLRVGIFNERQLRALRYGEMPFGIYVSAIRADNSYRDPAGIIRQKNMALKADGPDDNIEQIVSTMFCIEQAAFLVVHTENYGPEVLDLIKRFMPEISEFPRRLYPLSRKSTGYGRDAQYVSIPNELLSALGHNPFSNRGADTDNIWFTNDTLRALGLAWACGPDVPPANYGMWHRWTYRTGYESQKVAVR
ncbi:hypothetical protein FEE59_02820 [Herbaspirillum sp. RU 5E]|nr:hypothetical protein [Herbaspirillum sp. RU 5E]